ncbi:MAG: DUF4282 domain-containing protein [Alphaproteobacteria bacterium]
MGHLGRGRLGTEACPYNHDAPRTANAGNLRHVWPEAIESVASISQRPAKFGLPALRLQIEKALEAKAAGKAEPDPTPARRRRKQGLEQAMELGDLFSFDKKVAPSIIKPIYWIGMVLIIFVNIIYFFFGFGRLFTVGFFTGVWEMLAAIVSTTFGVLGLRIGAELCLAVFEIHEKTTSSSGS